MLRPSKEILIETLKIMSSEYRLREIALCKRLEELGAEGLEDPDYRELVALQTNIDRIRGLIMWIEQGEKIKQ